MIEVKLGQEFLFQLKVQNSLKWATFKTKTLLLKYVHKTGQLNMMKYGRSILKNDKKQFICGSIC